MSYREAYSVVAKLYECTFACEHSIQETYVNFELDVLYLDWVHFESYAHYYWGAESYYSDSPLQIKGWNVFRSEDMEDLGRVEKLAVRVLPPQQERYHPIDEEDLANLLRGCRGVKELYLALVDYHEDEIQPSQDQHSTFCLMGAFDVDEAIASYKNFVRNSEDEYYKAAGDAGRIDFPELVGINGPPISEHKMKVLQECHGC